MTSGRTLHLDEITAMPADVSTVLHPAIDGRGAVCIDDRPDAPHVQAKPGFYVIGAYNPGSLGARRLPEALTSRFSVQVTVLTDYGAARPLGVPPTSSSPSPRTWR
jgi:MoxR-like ATPase